MADTPSSQSTRVEHPSVAPWQELKQLLDPRVTLAYECAPEAPLDAHLAERRALASLVVKAAHRVIDTIDRTP